ncbi:c6 transcription factor [Pyrenophora seminiperda CCB06]|uniref:C6 transcription factor n=1 Tax=Pyrenophora seminiperda CCB06 TaxID=1302712 RepID=A0A3M7LWC3_9PLEO|nr:c6 transcription factor [Pyrenophora seminiperda CCB06]
MVSTRSTPKGDFPAVESSPTKKAPRSRTSTPDPSSISPPVKSMAKRAADKVAAEMAPPSPSEIGEEGWCHTASNITLGWIAVSWPLVLWDCLYILLRPHTMAGGALQWPLWKPYEIYASIDHVYGWPGWERGDGFGGAQGVLNAVELVLYGLYAMVVCNHGVPTAGGAGVQVRAKADFLGGGRKVRGKTGNRAVLIGFAAAVMTLSKTVLYYFNEYYSGFANVKHNDWLTLLWFYGVMNGLWVAFPAYMTIVFGTDIIHGLDMAAESSSKKRN